MLSLIKFTFVFSIHFCCFLDICTNVDALDFQVVYDNTNLTWYCDCERTSDNTKSYIDNCYYCPANTVFSPAMEICVSAVNFQCTAGK